MNKSDAMQMVNDHIGGRVLKGSGRNANTHFSNIINRSTKQVPHVWWFNIPPQKFRNELHLLCAKNPGLIWLRLDAGAIPNPGSVFRVRSDKDLIDLVIAIGGNRHLRDVNSGGTGYDFRPHIAYEWDDDPTGDTHESATQLSKRDKAGETDGARDDLPTGRRTISQGQVIVISPTKTTVFNPGDPIPPIIELHEAAASLAGGPVFDGTDVPVEYLFYYMDKVHNLHAFLDDFPQVSRAQALEALEERLQKNIDGVVNSDRDYVSGTPRFNGTRMMAYDLFDYLADGYTIEGFLANYDTSVTPEHSAKVIEAARQLVELYAYKSAFRRIDANR